MHVIATAGHVDHGKSTLVRALTGMEPDRFAEEKRRGMTIDLGYAWTTLPSGEQLAFVDVPGHQRFIANMLAGLGPAPGVLFVVAADEGWSRQSEEHLAAIHALDLRHGLLAVTRADLASAERTLVESLERIRRSSLGAVEAVVCSGMTGAGLADLSAALDRLVGQIPAADPTARIRLWVDRSFSVRGSGTVVTGTLSAGSVAVGDELELRGRAVAVRGMQSAGEERELVAAPARIALNLRGIGRDEVGRGDVLVTPDAWHWTHVLDVRVDSNAELQEQFTLHVGTAAVPVHARVLGGRIARLTASRDLPVQVGDRAVLRDPGRHAVVAGVLVLDPDPPALTRRGAAAHRAVQLDVRASDAAAYVRERGTVRRDHLQRLGIPAGSVPDREGWLVDDSTWQAWVADAAPAVQTWSAQHPLEPAMPIAALARSLGLPDLVLLPGVLAAAGLSAHDGRVGQPVASSLGPAEAGVRALEQRLAEAAFAAPESGELAGLGLGPRELAAAERAGRLLRLGTDIVLLPSAPSHAIDLLGRLPQPFTTSQARQALGTTRRVAIPLLEHLDGLGRTVRVDAATRRVVPDTVDA
jgi:selenocysteine-specific elongation factor